MLKTTSSKPRDGIPTLTAPRPPPPGEENMPDTSGQTSRMAIAAPRHPTPMDRTHANDRRSTRIMTTPPADRGILHARRRFEPCHSAVNRLHGRKRVGFAGGLVGAVSLYTCKPQREPSGILRTFLNLIERDLDHELRPHMDDVCVARHFQLEQPGRLPRQHLISHALERLAEHHEAAALGVARAQMQVAQRAMAP